MPTPTPAERMAHARAAMLAQAVTKAHERATTLGIELSPEQAAEAGARILKQDQRDRMAAARSSRWPEDHADQKRAADVDWAVTQAHRYADTLHAFQPTVPDSDQFRICVMAVADELRAPDQFSRTRLIKRLDALVQHVRQQSAEDSRKLSKSLVEPVPDDLPTLDDVLLESGEGTWSGLTDGDVR